MSLEQLCRTRPAYTLKEIASCLVLHYVTVSKVVGKSTGKDSFKKVSQQILSFHSAKLFMKKT